MSSPYEELLQGAPHLRTSPGPRHEQICARLHHCVHSSIANLSSTTLLSPRSAVRVAPDSVLRPDLALTTIPGSKLWLAAEIVSSEDHAPDTVIKKQIYEEIRIPRLWIIDPRYDNVEIYQATQYGMVLKCILAGTEILSEKLLPEFQITIQELFKAA